MKYFCIGLNFIISLLLLIQTYICEDSEVELCVTYSTGVQCGDGSHVTLTRIEGHEVGYTQTVTIEDEGKNISIKTISTKPLILEIDNFLSSSECDHIKDKAVRKGLAKSSTEGTFNGTGGFSLLDVNNDMKLSIDELKLTIRKGLAVFLDNKDVEEILKETGWDEDEDGFLSPSEITFSPEDLIEKVNNLLERYPEKLARMSNQTVLYADNIDSVYSKIQKRLAEVVSLPQELIKMTDLQVVTYNAKGHYNAHVDSTDGNLPCCSRERKDRCRFCRYMSVMFYLNDVEEGGETVFPLANNSTADLSLLWKTELPDLEKICAESALLVKPDKGKAIIWYNHFVDESSGWIGNLDLFTVHGGCPVTKGTKWIATVWVTMTTDKTEDLKLMQKYFTKDKERKKILIKQEL